MPQNWWLFSRLGARRTCDLSVFLASSKTPLLFILFDAAPQPIWLVFPVSLVFISVQFSAVHCAQTNRNWLMTIINIGSRKTVSPSPCVIRPCPRYTSPPDDWLPGRSTIHFFLCRTTDDTHTLGLSRKFGVRTSHSMCHPHPLMLCVWFSSATPLSSLCCLSSFLSSCLSFWPSTSYSRMWWTNSLCTLANEDLGTLSQVMSPTTTTSRRLLNRTSRNPQARMGPWMNSSTMTWPSASRSLHHCSPRSEKMIRAVDEPITLKKKDCRPVCRPPSVMIERGDLLWNSLIHNFETSEKSCATAQKMSKSGFFWNDKESSFSLTVKQRDSKTRGPGRLRQKKHSKVEWNDRVSRNICGPHQGDEQLRQDHQLLH